MFFRQIKERLSPRQIRTHTMLMQPYLCLTYNGLRRILDAADGLVHGCPENNIGCLRNFRFSIFDHVGLDLLSVKAEQRLVALFYKILYANI